MCEREGFQDFQDKGSWRNSRSNRYRTRELTEEGLMDLSVCEPVLDVKEEDVAETVPEKKKIGIRLSGRGVLIIEDCF